MNTVSRKSVARYMAQAWVEKSVPRSKLLQQMAAYLIDSKKTNQADLLIEDMKAEIEFQYGVVVAKVVTARKLTADLSKQIESFVKDKTKARKVVITESIDTSLIGGFIATTPSAEFDYSIRTKLNKLKV